MRTSPAWPSGQSRKQPLIRAWLTLSSYTSIAVFLISIAVLAGYAMGWRWAWRPIEGGRSIHPLSALCFAAIGLATWLLRTEQRNRFSLVFTIIGGGLAGLLLYDLATGATDALNAMSPFHDMLAAEASAGRPIRIMVPTTITLVLFSIALVFYHAGRGPSVQAVVGLASMVPAGAVIGYGLGMPGPDGDMGPMSAVLGVLCAFSIAGRTAHRVPLRSFLTNNIEGRLIRGEGTILVGVCLVLAAIAAWSGFERNFRELGIEAAVLAIMIVLTLAAGAHCWHQEELTRRRLSTRDPLAADLDGAWRRGEISLFYQPQIRLVDEALVGVEALVRWQHPERGLVPPDEFIPIAEQSGLIVPLGEWIFATACERAAQWRTGALSRIVIAINVSPYQLEQDDCAERMIEMQRQSGVSPSRIVIEVTEGILIERGDKALAALRGLQDAGMLVAIDDFGTGYSSLSSLRILPSRYLKIDRSFVQDVPGNDAAAMIVRAVIGMGLAVGMKVIAEGVETREQAVFLKEIGCEKAQGYFYGRPMLPDDLISWSSASVARSLP